MLVQRIISGGREVYSGVITLAFLTQAFNRSSSFGEKFPSLAVETKAVDEIATLIVDRITQEQSWWMGGLSFAIYPQPSFHPLTSEQETKEDPGTWGKLDITETAVWYPLDGYQRLRAMLQAHAQLTGQKRKALEAEMIPVLILPAPPYAECDEILRRMHRSARAVDRGKAIRTTIDDRYARYARRLMGEEKGYPETIKKALINWQSNTLTTRLEKFSTLSVLYDSAKMLDQALIFIADEEERYHEIAKIWSLLLTHFFLFRESARAPKLRPRLRSQFLCLKPTGQLIIIAVIALAVRTCDELPLEEVVARLNEVPWEIDQPYWQGIVVVDGRIHGRENAISLTSRLIAHLIGVPLSDMELEALKEDYQRAKGEKEALPPPLFPQNNA